MKAVEMKQNPTLTQEDLDYIMNQPIPRPQLISLIQDAAGYGACQGSSYVNVYWLGVLHGMRTGQQLATGI